MRASTVNTIGGFARTNLVSAVLACGSMSGIAHADVVIPSSMGSVPDLNSNGLVFAMPAANYAAGVHIQLFVGASELSSLAVGAQISGMAFRLYGPAAGAVSGPSVDVTYPQFNVMVSPAATTNTTFSPVFANNLLNPVVVRSGPLTVPAGSFVGGLGAPTPYPFYQMVVFSTPYVYLGGDLVVDIAYASHNGPTFWELGAGPRNLDGTLPYRCIVGLGMNSEARNLEQPFPVMTFVTVPSPASAALIGFGALASTRRRRGA